MHLAGERHGAGRANLTNLRRVGVAVPILAVIIGEAARYLFPAGELVHHLVWGAIAVVAISLFAVTMFWSIGRAEREVLRQNRELAAVNAVSRSVQDPDSSQDVVMAALRSIVSTTYAARASVRIYPVDGEPAPAPISFQADDAPPEPLAGIPLELPMTTESEVVGLLQVWPTVHRIGPGDADGLSPAALQNISHQLGCAIQHRRLVEDLRKRELQATALYDVAVMVSAQQSLADTLARVSRSARELLAADEVALCLTPAASDAVATSRAAGSAPLPLASDGAICVVPGPDGVRAAHDHRAACPVRADAAMKSALELPIRTAETTLGDIWVGRRGDRPFDSADRSLLSGLADLASIAITSARLRDRDRVNATVAERERIARELHDSLGQVLGVAHLRLRAIGSNDAVRGAPELATEIESLADLAQEAFQDVREAILGLRASSTPHREFLPSLAAYLDKFGRQAGVPVRLEANEGTGALLSPASEIQVIRVIQEALANVRKHAGAEHAVVRLTDDGMATTIEIEDDGRGFEAGHAHEGRDTGFGLQTMRERMELVGGTLVVESGIGRGTRVIARVPRERLRGRFQMGGADAAEAVVSGSAGR